jgi:ergothioneine biosynthesis protein EgtB
MSVAIARDADHLADTLLQRFRDVRQRSVDLAAPLSAEDAGAQSMPDASPAKWHLAHTSWFFETFVLDRFEADFVPHHPAFRMLFNSSYNGVGDKHARRDRGLLTRPSLDDVLAYRAAIDARVLRLLTTVQRLDDVLALIELGCQHEQQHQELMLSDVLHLLSTNPMQPVYSAQAVQLPRISQPSHWQKFDAVLIDIGHADDANANSTFCFDNEQPRHRQFVASFSLATTLVSNGDYLEFVEAGGYADATLWLSEGWDWLQRESIDSPLHWRHTNHGWTVFTLRGAQPLDLTQPLCHVSYFEAEAFARWSQARLPTEVEWEYAAGQHAWPDLFGSCWQWTSSSYAAYPGYAAAKGALGEYNGKFMVNQYVLRGSSFATAPAHARHTYRNFFPATARWQFRGVRLAR